MVTDHCFYIAKKYVKIEWLNRSSPCVHLKWSYKFKLMWKKYCERRGDNLAKYQRNLV